jgi:hypothetical protein
MVAVENVDLEPFGPLTKLGLLRCGCGTLMLVQAENASVMAAMERIWDGRICLHGRRRPPRILPEQAQPA